MAATEIQLLHQLAELYHVQLWYWDVAGQRKEASQESLFITLQSLGAPLHSYNDIPKVIQHREIELKRRLAEPVCVSWNGEQCKLDLHIPERLSSKTIACELQYENGACKEWSCDLSELSVIRQDHIGDQLIFTKLLVLTELFPLGYHQLTLKLNSQISKTLIISAPSKAYPAEAENGKREWGIFAPLYALHSKKSWGAGDLSDLEKLKKQMSKIGGSVIATLPLLAAFLDEPCEASPYSPASRLFWNEMYLDVSRIPELQKNTKLKKQILSPAFRNAINKLRSAPLVDYKNVMLQKRKILEKLSEQFFKNASASRMKSFEQFKAKNPNVGDYARFRAVHEQLKLPWTLWHETMDKKDYDPKNMRYHLYVQWQMHEQLKNLAHDSGSGKAGLYLDFPLGVHPDGYDIWSEKDVFALKASCGAPPDALFTKGQNWGFPPMHPDKIREQGYRYYIACVRNHLQYSKLLRLDHVMGYHRIFWIPQSLDAEHSTYVRYHPEEFYAILSLESHRYKSVIVGENLGIVPPEVNAAMSEHNIYRMYVLGFEMASKSQPLLKPPEPQTAASLNTHDMHPFAAYWNHLDIEERVELEILKQEKVPAEKQDREWIKTALIHYLSSLGEFKDQPANLEAVFQACLRWMSSSRSEYVLINLEDLWHEVKPQNIPSSGFDYPNWLKRMKYSIEEIFTNEKFLGILKEVNDLRKRKISPTLDPAKSGTGGQG